MKPVLF